MYSGQRPYACVCVMKH